MASCYGELRLTLSAVRLVSPQDVMSVLKALSARAEWAV